MRRQHSDDQRTEGPFCAHGAPNHRHIAAEAALKIVVTQNRHSGQARRRRSRLRGARGRRSGLREPVLLGEIPSKRNSGTHQVEEVRGDHRRFYLFRAAIVSQEDIAESEDTGHILEHVCRSIA